VGWRSHWGREPAPNRQHDKGGNQERQRSNPSGLGDLLPPSPPAKKATARQQQDLQSCAGDGTGDLNQSVPISGTALFEFSTVAANISELFRPFEKPPLAALPLFVCCR
jgi:hypothetical protein